jgi:hypothetical protein
MRDRLPRAATDGVADRDEMGCRAITFSLRGQQPAPCGTPDTDPDRAATEVTPRCPSHRQAGG